MANTALAQRRVGNKKHIIIMLALKTAPLSLWVKKSPYISQNSIYSDMFQM